jgi:hypothetical protein
MVFSKHVEKKGFAFQCIFLWCFEMKTFVCQSIDGLCKMNQDNPMMIGFVEDEMTLRTILVECNSMVISNALVSCVTSPKKKFQLLMILIAISVITITNCACGSLILIPYTSEFIQNLMKSFGIQGHLLL